MHSVIGYIGLCLALVAAAAQLFVPVRLKKTMALCCVGGMGAAFISLVSAFVSSDFSVHLVAQHSHSAKPLFYKITGVWGNHEGSMLLMVGILSFLNMLFVSSGQKHDKLYERTSEILSMILVGFLMFLILVSSPFTQMPVVPGEGASLNPLLQDPILAIHPPFLYLGTMGFAVVFALCVGGLLAGQIDRSWARRMRRWSLFSWSFLGIGLVLGSWWAFTELGWGGWWFWDPVENAALMPWLAATALIHTLRCTEKQGVLKGWSAFLGLLCFTLCMIGVFLVRSGVLTSVHAFAIDPARGVFVLLLLLIMIGGGFGVFAAKGPKQVADSFFAPLSRESALLFNTLFLLAACGVVFLGTIYPLVLEAFDMRPVAVGAPFYNQTVVPMFLPLLVLMGAGPFLSWRKADIRAIIHRFGVMGVIGGIGVILAIYISQGGPVLAYFGIAGALWVLGSGGLMIYEKRADLLKLGMLGHLGMIISHLGVGIAVLGMVGSTVWRTDYSFDLGEGEEVTIGSYIVSLEQIKTDEVDNYGVITAHLSLRDGQSEDFIAYHSPQRRWYGVRQKWTNEASIAYNGLNATYTTLGERDKDDRWFFRLSSHPLIVLLWVGCFLTIFGGILCLVSATRLPIKIQNLNILYNR